MIFQTWKMMTAPKECMNHCNQYNLTKTNKCFKVLQYHGRSLNSKLNPSTRSINQCYRRSSWSHRCSSSSRSKNWLQKLKFRWSVTSSLVLQVLEFLQRLQESQMPVNSPILRSKSSLNPSQKACINWSRSSMNKPWTFCTLIRSRMFYGNKELQVVLVLLNTWWYSGSCRKWNHQL